MEHTRESLMKQKIWMQGLQIERELPASDFGELVDERDSVSPDFGQKTKGKKVNNKSSGPYIKT